MLGDGDGGQPNIDKQRILVNCTQTGFVFLPNKDRVVTTAGQ